MVKAFVFGKFLPFHKGHEAMIRFALTQCDFLSVLVCCSDREDISCAIRKDWIASSFKASDHLEVVACHYLEAELPNTSVSSPEVSKIWSDQFKKLFPDYNLVVTSEKYGEYIAGFMGIKHIPFDLSRQRFPVSATEVRRDPFAFRKYLPAAVKPFYTFKVAVLGTESTGKSILSEKLARHFGCTLVRETARDMISDSRNFSIGDLYGVAAAHADRIEEAVRGDNPLVVIDTDVHLTKSYALFVFGAALEVSDEIYRSNKADLYLYLANDVEYMQDGTRLNEAERNLLDSSHREVLKDHGIDFVEITGPWEERFKKAIVTIDEAIRSKYR